MGSQRALYWAGATAAAIVVVGAIVFYSFVPRIPEGSKPPAVATSSEAPPPAKASAPAAAPEKPAEIAKAAPPQPTEPAAQPKPAASPAPAPAKPKPSFDVVRVEKSGEAVIAGRAGANETVELRDRGVKIAEASADSSGQFVIVPEPLAPGEHSLTLATRGGKTDADVSEPVAVSVAPATAKASTPAVASAEPPAPAAPAPSKPETAPAKPAAAESASTTEAPAKPETAPAKPAPAEPATTAAAPVQPETAAQAENTTAQTPKPEATTTAANAEPPAATLKPAAIETPPAAAPAASSQPQIVASAPAPGPSPEVEKPAPANEVAIVSVDATGDGRLVVKGAAPANAMVRLYLNGTFIADATANSDSKWSLTVEHGMTAGAYAIRADELNRAGGAVVAHAETSFDYPETPAQEANKEPTKVAPAEPTPAVAEAETPQPPAQARASGGRRAARECPARPGCGADRVRANRR